MSLSIPERYITNLDNFTWGDDWRATRIIKEKRVHGDYYFANIVRYYGTKEDTDDYDISESFAESAWLGRNEKFVGKRTHDTNPDSPSFGKRVYTEAITETITEDDSRGHPTERTVLVDGKAVYEYIIPVNVENTKKMKTLAGAIALNQETQFLFIYGAQPPHSIDPKTFWSVSVSFFLQRISPLNQEKKSGRK